MPSAIHESHFRIVQKFDSEYSPNTFTEYESKRTGMRVVAVDQKGPKVLGFFALATEIHDDSGAPHTLEHLCFMGSKSYPYKGVLDKLATRAYSNTNAWTATDHTAYTLETAGWAGFAQILPVYLEHVLVPTLTDAGCYTEVHHIDGTGHDAGVVYSEMQGVQNDQSEIMELRSKRLMYPEGVGFRYETGGMMEQLRVLTADRIRSFHREMYQPKNLCLAIVGEIDHEELLLSLDDFEETILNDIPKPDAPFKRPWVGSESKLTPPLQKSVIETVEFPEEDESSGEIMVSFFGPNCNDVLQMGALSTLLTYLAGSSASILENTLVEKEQVASAVYFGQESRPDTVVQFSLSSVDAGKLAEVEARFFEVLKDTSSKELDMSYMKDCIARGRRQQKFYAENTDAFFINAIIANFLFDDRDGSTLRHIGSLREYDELETWTDTHWRAFLKKWISDAPHITILGKPSAALSKKIKEDEEARVAAQKAKLGESGLKELEEKLAEAKAENDREIPKDILQKFAVPETSSIHFIDTTCARSGAARDLGVPENSIQKIIDQDRSELPLFIHFEHVPSNFIHIHLLLGTASVPIGLRPMLAVYMDNFFNAPIMRNGHKIEFEQVVIELEKDTVEYGMETASSLGSQETLCVVLQVEKEKYGAAIHWLQELLWDGIFDVTRLLATTVKLLSDIPEEKRSGSSMSSSVASMINYAPESISRSRDTLVKALYLKRVKRLLESEPEKVVAQLEEIRTALCQISNFRVLVIADVRKLGKPVSSWEKLAIGRESNKTLAPLDKGFDRLSKAGKKPGDAAFIIPLATIDSSFALAVGKGPEDMTDPRTPALIVATCYLDAVEGPLWTAVRGTGLAYGTGFRRSVNTGHVQFQVYRSPDVFKAFAASKKVVEDFISGATAFDSLALEGAISSVVLDLANGQSTMAKAAQQSFTRQVIRGLPNDWNTVLLKKVRSVTVSEIKMAMKEILLPIFVAQTSNLFVTCAPIMEEGLVKGFEEAGFKPQVKALTFFQDDYGLKTGNENDDLDNDDDDMEETDDDAMSVDSQNENKVEK